MFAGYQGKHLNMLTTILLLTCLVPTITEIVLDQCTDYCGLVVDAHQVYDKGDTIQYPGGGGGGLEFLSRGNYLFQPGSAAR